MEAARSSILLCLFSAVLFVAVQAGQDLCAGRPEGYVALLDCQGYSVCRGGRLVTLECPKGLVLDRRSKLCYPVGSGVTACGLPGNCAGRRDGNYPDVSTGCRSFIACDGGSFRGRIWCPDGLLFNIAKNQCDYPDNVPYPCGPGRRQSTSYSSYGAVAAASQQEDDDK